MAKIDRVEISGELEIEFEEAGSGARAFVLVHGFTGSRDDWREHLPPLSRLGRTLALDQRGHGGSSNTGDPAGYTLDGLRADLAECLSTLDANPCDLLGHSMGGMVALRYVLAYPERIRSLILMDTAAGALEVPEATRKIMEGVAQLARSAGMGAVVEMMRGAMEGGALGAAAPAAADAFDTSFERTRPKLEQMDPEAFATLGQSLFQEPDVIDRLSEIRCPTTVIVGEADLPFREASEVMAAEIQEAELVVIPESAHQPQLENPKAWLEAVEHHLRRVRSS